MTLSPEKGEGTLKDPLANKKDNKKIYLLVLLAGLFIVGAFLTKQYLNLDYIAEQEIRLKQYYADNPFVVFTVAFLIYALVTGLSIPGALALSLLYAWFFGFTRGLVLISFASTAGATIAFLTSRYVLRDWIQSKFGDRLKTVNEAFDREGNFYLFLMRLIPAVPFFVINLVMGLTQIKTITFWWVSQLGMLAGTAVYVYAGSTIPDIQTLKTEGVKAVFTPSQLIQFTIAFILIGLFPIVAKKIATRFSDNKSDQSLD